MQEEFICVVSNCRFNILDISIMKKLYNLFFDMVLIVLPLSLSSCSDYLNTSSSTDVSTELVEGNITQLEKVLISTYKNVLFTAHVSGAIRVYAGVPGLCMYNDLRGADICCSSNMGSVQCQAYNFDPSITQYNGLAGIIWAWAYNSINQSNIIIDDIDKLGSNDATSQHIKGQALGIRGISYFYLLLNYQQTYAVAKNKPGVILHLSSMDNANMGRSTVEQCYAQVVKDLLAAQTLLADYTRDSSEPWRIDKYVVAGHLARVYQVMQSWQGAYDEAKIAYDAHSELMSKQQWTSGFDDVISNGNKEVFWAIKYTDTDNVGGAAQYNFWYNQDESYGEGATSGPIYSFINFMCVGEYRNLFDEGDYRGAPSTDGGKTGMFWQRTKNSSTEYSTKWAYNKWKHYGTGGIQSDTRPEVPMMRSSEMLLIMAEASAHLNNGLALTLLNRLQSARGAKLTTATGDALLESIYVERRKELLGEGVTGAYDLLRLQKPLVRYQESTAYSSGHYTWGCANMETYVATGDKPYGRIESNDYRFICQIPQLEITSNGALSESDQNPYNGQ